MPGLTCRTCCKKERVKYIPVDAVDQNGMTIIDMIYQITDVLVTLELHLPQQICTGCLDELRAAHSFRQKCINSNSTLRRTILKPNDGFPLTSNPQFEMVLKQEFHDPELNVEEDTLYNKVETEVDKQMQEDDGIYLNMLTSRNRSFRKKERSLQSIANEHIRLVDNKYVCAMNDEVECAYAQRKYDPNNYVRHFRLKHRQSAIRLGLLTDTNQECKVEKKPRTITKQVIEMDSKHLIETSIKLVSIHNLPLDCFRWDGFQSIYKRLAEPMGLVIDSIGIIRCIKHSAERIVSQIRKEMSSKHVSILIDAALRHEKHVLTVSSHFELGNVIESRVLGIIWIKPSQTPKQLKRKVEQLLKQYELSNAQIYSIIFESAANILTTENKLHKSFRETARNNIGEDTDDIRMDKLDELLEALSAELRDQYNVIRVGPIRSFHLAMNEVLPDIDSNLCRLDRISRELHKTKYDEFFNGITKCYPPIYSGNRWIYKYKLIRKFYKQKQLLTSIAQKHPEVALHDYEWQYVEDFNEAFEPLYDITKRMQTKHHTFSEFYMQWLMAIKELRTKTNNRFSKPLTESLTKQATALRENIMFRACMYLDPRFNYCDSVVFTSQQRDDAKNYIISIWNRIQNLRPDLAGYISNYTKVKHEDEKDDMDDFLTEMFGGPSEGTSNSIQVSHTSGVTPILHQLKSLEIEPRRAHTYDVWNHWVQRVDSHAELFTVAMVVLSLPSNNVNLERAFTALVLSDRKDGLSDKHLEDLLLVRLNRNLFEKVAMSMSDWKQVMES